MVSGLCVPAQWTRAPCTTWPFKTCRGPLLLCPLGALWVIGATEIMTSVAFQLCLLSSWSGRDAVLPPHSVVAQRAENLKASSVCTWIHRMNPLLALPLIFCVLPLWQSAAGYFHGTNEKKIRVASGFYFPPLELCEMWLLAAASLFLLPPSPFSPRGGRV